jgi:hypothetical protein
MLVILARQQDQTANVLGERWKEYHAHLLTSADLSTAGWHHHLPENGGSQAVVGGRVVATEEIAGVLTRLPYVDEGELYHIVPEDRAYVSSEMTAFLVSWLSGLTCPVLNRPSPACLIGPNWRPEQWVHLAAQLGIPVCPVRRDATLTREAWNEVHRPPLLAVTVVGNRWFGGVDHTLAAQARRLAQAAGVDLLAAYFQATESGYAFRGVDLQPDVSSPQVADAILEYLTVDSR